MMIEHIMKGDRELVATLATFPQRFHARLVRVMRRLGVQLQTKVRSEKLHGQVLRNRSGHLWNSIGWDTTEAVADVTTRVGVFKGPALVYGRAHEFGFDGVVTVRAHLRQIKEAFGRSIAPMSVSVRSYPRHMHLPVRSFLGSAFGEFADTIVTTLDHELTEATSA